MHLTVLAIILIAINC